MHISSSIPYITFGWNNLLFQTQHRISNETKLHSLQDDRKRQALAGWPRKGRRKYRKRAWQRTVHLVEECEPDLRSAPRSVERWAMHAHVRPSCDTARPSAPADKIKVTLAQTQTCSSYEQLRALLLKPLRKGGGGGCQLCKCEGGGGASAVQVTPAS